MPFAQCAGVNLYHHKRRKPKKHDHQILMPIMESRRNAFCSAFALQIQLDQVISGRQEKHCSEQCNTGYDPQLETDGLPDALIILLAKILCCKDPGAGYAAEQAQIIHENQLIDDVIEQTHEVGNAVLYHDGYSDGKNHFIECFIAYKFM